MQFDYNYVKRNLKSNQTSHAKRLKRRMEDYTHNNKTHRNWNPMMKPWVIFFPSFKFSATYKFLKKHYFSV